MINIMDNIIDNYNVYLLLKFLVINTHYNYQLYYP